MRDVGLDVRGDARLFDNHKRFVLDKTNFSSIIYILRESPSLSPLIGYREIESSGVLRQLHS